MRVLVILVGLAFGLLWQLSSLAQQATEEPRGTGTGDALLNTYFQQQTAQLTEACLSEVRSLEDWTSRRAELRRQLLEMLGLDPLPQRTSLQPVVTGMLEHDDIIVERLHFQSLPGLYVTANLYRPRSVAAPLPTVLYGCGHASVKQDGISFGNKTRYQHHGIWFARNGYVALVLDTIQLGEIEGLHHGTYRAGQWWWNNRGYTPAGVEAWNCVRAIDYLQSREEVDGQRIGMTGRSGGGVYSWWTSAIDDRIQAVVPVAGITSLQNHVVDGCVEGHCDCMFMVNTYQWDFPLLGALIAPRPLLISNSDKDSIFPLDGVIDVHRKVRRIYQLYGAEDQLGLNITEGPHKDTQELRVHAFRWLNRFLKDDSSLVTIPAEPLFEPHQLRVFETLPTDQRVTTIAETFVPAAPVETLPKTAAEFQAAQRLWLDALLAKSFRGWPQSTAGQDLQVQVVAQRERAGVQVQVVEFTSQPPYRLPVYRLRAADAKPDRTLAVRVLTQQDWEQVATGLAHLLPDAFPGIAGDESQWKQLAAQAETEDLAFVVPRGVGPTQWSTDKRERTHIRRRFMLLGQTVAGMQIYDVR